MSRKQVLFLTSWYPSDENTTLGNFVVKHAQCSAEVANITVLYARSSSKISEVAIDDQVEDGVRVVRVYYPKESLRFPFLGSYKKFKSYKKALWLGFRHINLKFDLVQVNVAFPAGLFALELKNKYNLPFVLLEHWTGYLSHTNSYKSAPLFLKLLHKKVFSNASKVLVVSDHLGKSLKALDLTKDYIVYPNVVDRKYFYPLNEFTGKSILNILHVSSFNDEHKNISGMLSAIASLKRQYHLNLITEGEESDVFTYLDDAGIVKEDVSIKTKLSAEEVGNEMRKSDVLVLFSNYETFSVVIAEAWTCGLPAVYSKCGGLTEIDNDTLGKQIAKKDERALSDYLESFDSNNYSKEEIAKYAQSFEKHQLSDKIHDVYDQLC